MVNAGLGELQHAGVTERPRTVLADAGYWHRNQMEHRLASGFQVLVPADSIVRQGARPGGEGGMYSFMRRVLSTDLGRELYEKRRRSIERRASGRLTTCRSWRPVGIIPGERSRGR
jgi:hypothetical protein